MFWSRSSDIFPATKFLHFLWPANDVCRLVPMIPSGSLFVTMIFWSFHWPIHHHRMKVHGSMDSRHFIDHGADLLAMNTVAQRCVWPSNGGCAWNDGYKYVPHRSWPHWIHPRRLMLSSKPKVNSVAHCPGCSSCCIDFTTDNICSFFLGMFGGFNFYDELVNVRFLPLKHCVMVTKMLLSNPRNTLRSMDLLAYPHWPAQANDHWTKSDSVVLTKSQHYLTLILSSR